MSNYDSRPSICPITIFEKRFSNSDSRFVQLRSSKNDSRFSICRITILEKRFSSFFLTFTTLMKHARLICLMLLLPIIFIGVGRSHDWGDDFAQYLLQAKNIVERTPQTNNGLVFPATELPYAISAYPMGFPLLIAPIYYFAQLSISPYIYLNGIVLVLLACLSFDYSKIYFDSRKSLLIALLIGYNLLSLTLKQEILSEFAFAATLLAIILMLRKSDRRTVLLAGLLAGILVSFRIVGLLILPAFWLMLVFSKTQNRQEKHFLGLLFFTSCFAIALLLNVILFDIKLSHFFRFYELQLAASTGHSIGNVILIIENLPIIFLPFLKNRVISYFILILVSNGFISRIKNAETPEWFFLLYVILLCIFPYHATITRFLFPVAPLLIIYFFIGAEKIFSSFLSIDRSFEFLSVITALSIIYSFYFLSKQSIPDGPYSTDANAAFSFIKNNTAENDIVLFSRARALHLYTGRRSTFLTQLKSPEENLLLLRSINCKYILAADERSGAYNESLAVFLMAEKNQFDTTFIDGRFRLLKLKEPLN